MNKYWCDYNILITSSPFFVAALIKIFTVEPFSGFFTFIFHCNINFWASDFVAAFYFPFFISRHSLEHSICACCPLTQTCVCLNVVARLLSWTTFQTKNKSIIKLQKKKIKLYFRHGFFLLYRGLGSGILNVSEKIKILELVNKKRLKIKIKKDSVITVTFS